MDSQTTNQSNQDPVESSISPKASPILHKKRRLFPFIFTFVIGFVTWIVLSGKFDIFHLSLGVVACLIVALVSGDLLVSSASGKKMPRQLLGFIRYLPWILYQIFLANIHVLKLVFHPRVKDVIDPKIIYFKSNLDNEMAYFIFANSITLTPGTITVYVSVDGNFSVHAIDKESGKPLPGEMETRIARIFSK